MNTLNKRGWIFGGAAALIMIGTIAQLTNSRAQNAASAPAPATAAASTNVAPAQLPKLPADLSPGLADVIKLVESNVGDDVVVGYIKNSGQIYKPTADEIVYLNDLGVSQDIISALMLNGQAGGAPAVASAPTQVAPAQQSQQIPTPPSNATLSSPEVPSYSVTQDQPLDASVPPPDVPVQVGAVEQTPPPEVTVNYFYDSLAPYGSWVDVEGYGRCWRPTVGAVSAGWRPYCDNGYWVYTDSGWYWQSYYSWGWAPFHYGRWCSTPRFGWVWMPDCTWGPAWVAWREHDRYCGWAPLPPHALWRPGVGIVWAGGHGGHGGHVDWGFGLSVGAFTFVAYDHFTDHHPWRHQPSHTEVVNIYNHSTVIKNVYVNNKTTVINNGIGRDKIVKATHKPIQTVVLKDAKSYTGNGRVEHAGGKPALNVYRPSPTTIAKTPVNHNKPVLINNAPHTTSAGSLNHSVFNSPSRTSANHSPISTPKAANNHDWASTPHSTPAAHPALPKSTSASSGLEVHQAWPGENTGRASVPHSSPAPAEKVASANNNRSFSHEPAVHSTLPSKTVEQRNNYFGSGAYHQSSPAASPAPHVAPTSPTPHVAPTAPAPHVAPSSPGGHANFGGGGGSFGGGHNSGGSFNRPDNGGHNR